MRGSVFLPPEWYDGSSLTLLWRTIQKIWIWRAAYVFTKHLGMQLKILFPGHLSLSCTYGWSWWWCLSYCLWPPSVLIILMRRSLAAADRPKAWIIVNSTWAIVTVLLRLSIIVVVQFFSWVFLLTSSWWLRRGTMFILPIEFSTPVIWLFGEVVLST